ncbi:HvfC/BufC N-terminal domain-containing protein [Rhizobium sp. SL42]|uniref:HvfC/BufC N-terminal domain-containing protein n=1 Tax=Rhizobium sp. SL42 TaxID=2806346 RepID=UPI001F178F3D|nr:putative DNA-binding domain-containing protein [Rhizobium sp. SL42]UJW74647.1 putative DNA-binding domain-containing protein [Rhizobium sp. SL42]
MAAEPVASGAFAAALLDPAQRVPDGLIAGSGSAVGRRFAVYRNNVMVSLVDALASIFPTVQNLVGEEFFRAVAQLHVRAHPPCSPLIFTYGNDFARFIQSFPPARDLPFLADVAQLERLWLDSFHSADSPSLDPMSLASIPPDDLGHLRFTAHPATRILRCRHAAATIVIRDRAGSALSDVNPMQAENALVTRPAFDVKIQPLPPGGYAFLTALIERQTLAEACEAAYAETAASDLATLLGIALSSGAFSSLDCVSADNGAAS